MIVAGLITGFLSFSCYWFVGGLGFFYVMLKTVIYTTWVLVFFITSMKMNASIIKLNSEAAMNG